MFKKIKNYFSLRRRIQAEILETLCSICLYLDFDGHFSKNRYAVYMHDHFETLKILSKELRSKEK